MNSNFGAQGTIEYLVIIAVIVVISLVVVGLFITLFDSPSQEIIDSSSKAGEVAVGGISIVESVIDPQGDSLIRLSNNSSDSITLTRVSVGGVDNNFSEQLVGLDSKIFRMSSLNSSCPCEEGQKDVKCEVKITYTTASGITQNEYRTISAQCVSDSVPVDLDVVVEPIVTILELGTLANPWIINDCQELQAMNEHLDGNYILGNDINCEETRFWGTWVDDCATGTNFQPIGSHFLESFGWIQTCSEGYFFGSFEGNNNTIFGLKSSINDQTVAMGIFVGISGKVNNLNIRDTNIYVEGDGKSAGILAGFISNYGNQVVNNVHISNSNIFGRSDGDTIGGIVGGVYAIISNSSITDSTITGNSVGSEITGFNQGTIENCSYSNISFN